MYGCTVVQDQCTVVVLYYCITSLPVYPNTVHGHCTTVVLDTSNIVYCIATLIECTVQCSASFSLTVWRLVSSQSWAEIFKALDFLITLATFDVMFPSNGGSLEIHLMARLKVCDPHRIRSTLWRRYIHLLALQLSPIRHTMFESVLPYTCKIFDKWRRWSVAVVHLILPVRRGLIDSRECAASFESTIVTYEANTPL